MSSSGRAFLQLMPRQRFMNAYVADVPGPPIPLYLAGAPVLELFPVVPIMGNMSIGVGALSYAGQLNITAVADRDVCPDLEAFMGGVRRSLQALERSLPQERSVEGGSEQCSRPAPTGEPGPISGLSERKESAHASHVRLHVHDDE